MMHVYRFGDLVAINPPEGATFYLSAREARELSKALMLGVVSINVEKFTESNVGTIRIDATGSRYRDESS